MRLNGAYCYKVKKPSQWRNSKIALWNMSTRGKSGVNTVFFFFGAANNDLAYLSEWVIALGQGWCHFFILYSIQI
jgi:hypothetical protein